MIVRRMQVLRSVHCIFVQVPIYRYLVTYIVQDYNLMHRLYRQKYLPTSIQDREFEKFSIHVYIL